eukprot:GHVP01054263.1.p1 GENE.GHVP01054263.1~~GHVP01054263.1.p1  ORF type:complete len:189 (-),score=40.86 GHVP01054263.1:165-731(-)
MPLSNLEIYINEEKNFQSLLKYLPIKIKDKYINIKIDLFNIKKKDDGNYLGIEYKINVLIELQKDIINEKKVLFLNCDLENNKDTVRKDIEDDKSDVSLISSDELFEDMRDDKRSKEEADEPSVHLSDHTENTEPPISSDELFDDVRDNKRSKEEADELSVHLSDHTENTGSPISSDELSDILHTSSD